MLNFHLNTEELSRSFQNVRAHVKSNSSGRLGGDMIVSLSHSFSAVFILYFIEEKGLNHGTILE
jgi:hypothetical protein